MGTCYKAGYTYTFSPPTWVCHMLKGRLYGLVGGLNVDMPMLHAHVTLPNVASAPAVRFDRFQETRSPDVFRDSSNSELCAMSYVGTRNHRTLLHGGSDSPCRATSAARSCRARGAWRATARTRGAASRRRLASPPGSRRTTRRRET